MKKYWLLVLVIYFGINPGFCQDISPDTEQKLEDLSATAENGLEEDSYLQSLDYYQRHPLNVNSAGKEELQTFKFLTDLQIENLIKHRQLLGYLIHIYELQAIAGWNVNTIKKILPYISVNALTPASFLSAFSGGEHSLLLRETKEVPKARGYNTALRTHYTGSNDHIFFRYKYQNGNNLQYGVTAEKDAGETFFKSGNTKGFDFYSAHIFAKNIGNIKAIALGDFTINMGQGLVQWQTLAFNKTSDAIAIKRQAPILLPYSSSGEFYFSRGAGLTVKKDNIEVTVFGLMNKISATTKSDTATGEKIITSFVTSGLFRTPTEMAKKNTVLQTGYGGNFNYQQNAFKIGINAVNYIFSHAIQKRAEAYNKYAITGRRWFNGSVNYSYTYKNMHLFGEAAIDGQPHPAFINGALVSLTKNVDASVLYRNINKAYQTLYGNAFTENVLPGNEKGIYIGATVRRGIAWRYGAYIDVYSFPWLKYKVDAPSKGYDMLFQVTYTPNKAMEVYLRFKQESKQANAKDQTLQKLVSTPRQNWRANFFYKINSKVALHNRTEVVVYNKTDKGILTFISATYKPKALISSSFRIQYFNTANYDTRIYAYEEDVLYSYSIPAYYGKGWRYYLNLNYDVSKKLTLWFRWAQTTFIDKSSSGSGLDEIKGNKKGEVKLQAKYIF